MASKGGTGRLPISILFYHNFRSFWRDCYPGTWYCWQIGSPSDNKSFIEINEENQLIIFGIDNRDSSVYNSQFMVGSNYQFPQDTLNTDLTYAAIGSKDTLFVNAGLYHFEIVDTVIIVKVPYFIVP